MIFLEDGDSVQVKEEPDTTGGLEAELDRLVSFVQSSAFCSRCNTHFVFNNPATEQWKLPCGHSLCNICIRMWPDEGHDWDDEGYSF
jgi:late competence protein required for DNA uptake (superfamily II DNA/RNA helicase)